ncbi:hypothetical protein VTK73DRAFT_2237 [Phialemonium thermophilum]|uniref:BSD domain-containing protein n=1 Tax=Phialemonium thermophilum TaxID=223376 RepID=A0ABR3X5H7_9PEZI
MDLAYDHIQEEAFPKETDEGSGRDRTGSEHASTLNVDIQEAYKAISSSPWGARIGGFFGNVVKQGESVYREAQHELTAVGQDATRGLSDLRDTLIHRTRSLSLTTPDAPASATEGAAPRAAETGEKDATPTEPTASAPDQALKESETVLSRLKTEAAKRLKDLQKAEDAADEALLKFGSNLRNFLKEAISIAPPAESSESQGSTILFESKDAQGKRVIHTSRFDAQLHVIHTTTENFVQDPASPEFEAWTETFDIGKKTDDIAKDLATYPELRATMEKLVPDQIPYADFWKRYYYLRHGLETAEARRRDLLKAASAEEEIGWDEDSEDEASSSRPAANKPERPASTASSTTIHPTATASDNLLKPAESRKSNDEKSQADSEASYDVIGAASGNPSQAPNSPKESRKGDESDDEDWE